MTGLQIWIIKWTIPSEVSIGKSGTKDRWIWGNRFCSMMTLRLSCHLISWQFNFRLTWNDKKIQWWKVLAIFEGSEDDL